MLVVYGMPIGLKGASPLIARYGYPGMARRRRHLSSRPDHCELEFRPEKMSVVGTNLPKLVGQNMSVLPA
jgi:hypothetical protein